LLDYIYALKRKFDANVLTHIAVCGLLDWCLLRPSAPVLGTLGRRVPPPSVSSAFPANALLLDCLWRPCARIKFDQSLPADARDAHSVRDTDLRRT